jgi:hypothetical protein
VPLLLARWLPWRTAEHSVSEGYIARWEQHVATPPLRLLIAGSRDWEDEEHIRQAIERARPTVLIHGACKRWSKERRRWVGADYLAGQIATELGITVIPYPADWYPNGEYDRGAGVKRNQRMLDEGRPDWVIAFADDLLVSRGTRDMIERAVEHGVERVYHYGHSCGWRTVVVPGIRPNFNLQRRESVA